METIGVRELRRDASRWLARVRGGEAFVITDRGRPVASLAPLPAAAGYEALVNSGTIAQGSGADLAAVVERIDRDLPPVDGPSVSAALDELRSGEG